VIIIIWQPTNKTAANTLQNAQEGTGLIFMDKLKDSVEK
jgi:hypothetical protein